MNGNFDARDHLRCTHHSKNDRSIPVKGTRDGTEVDATSAAVGFKAGQMIESFMNMPTLVVYGLAVWRPVAENFEAVMDKGLPFLRNKARQYKLI